MEVIKGMEIVSDETKHLGDDEAIPEGSRVSISLTRIVEDPTVLESGYVGARLNGTDELDSLLPFLGDVAFVALEFPKFADGRAYSFARLLRDRHNYDGELRATGDVLRDQLFYMRRCGFDVLEVRSDRDIEAALKGLKDFSVVYQTAADGAAPVYHHD